MKLKFLPSGTKVFYSKTKVFLIRNFKKLQYIDL